jgi:hypothetical protein
MRSSRVMVVMAAMGLAIAMSVLPTQVASAQPPSTAVVVPSSGATVTDLDGPAVLDATASAGVTQVQFEVTGGILNDWVIATATPTIYGWVALWNTDAVAGGTYTLQSVATADGSSVTSAGILITVVVSPPRLSIVLPPSGATVSGNQVVLDALGPAGLTGVFFLYYPPGCLGHGCTAITINATFTIWGYIAVWDSTQVPNGGLTISGDCNLCGAAGLPETSIQVDNPTVVFPANGSTVTGSQWLDCVPPAGYGGVQFWIEGASLSGTQLLGAATLTWVGWLNDWNTASVADGSYSIYCTAESPSGAEASSPTISVDVQN